MSDILPLSSFRMSSQKTLTRLQDSGNGMVVPLRCLLGSLVLSLNGGCNVHVVHSKSDGKASLGFAGHVSWVSLPFGNIGLGDPHAFRERSLCHISLQTQPRERSQRHFVRSRELSRCCAQMLCSFRFGSRFTQVIAQAAGPASPDGPLAFIIDEVGADERHTHGRMPGLHATHVHGALEFRTAHIDEPGLGILLNLYCTCRLIGLILQGHSSHPPCGHKQEIHGIAHSLAGHSDT